MTNNLINIEPAFTIIRVYTSKDYQTRRDSLHAVFSHDYNIDPINQRAIALFANKELLRYAQRPQSDCVSSPPA